MQRLIKLPSIILRLSKHLKHERMTNKLMAAMAKGNGKDVLSTGGVGGITHVPFSRMRLPGHAV